MPVTSIVSFSKCFLACHRLKAFADNNLKVVNVLDRVENVGNGENAGYQHFLLFPQCFHKPSCPRSLKVGIVWERVKCDTKNNFCFGKSRTFLEKEKILVSQYKIFISPNCSFFIGQQQVTLVEYESTCCEKLNILEIMAFLYNQV